MQAYDSLKMAVLAVDTEGPDRSKVMSFLESLGTSQPAYAGVSGTFAPTKNLDAREPHTLRVTQGIYKLLD